MQALAMIGAIAILVGCGAFLGALVTALFKRWRLMRLALIAVAASLGVLITSSALMMSRMDQAPSEPNDAAVALNAGRGYFAVPARVGALPTCRKLAAAFSHNRTPIAAKELESACQREGGHGETATLPEACRSWAQDIIVAAHKFGRLSDDPLNPGAADGLAMARERAERNAAECDATVSSQGS